MSAVGDILLAPDVRPFAVAAAIMVALGGIEVLSMLIGFSIGELFGKEIAVEADSHNILGGLFLWVNAGRLPFLILFILALGLFSIIGFLLHGIAHGAGITVPAWISALAAGAVSVPLIRTTSRGIARIIPRDESYAVDEADFKKSPVSAIASSREPPPFRRRSTMSPPMFSFFNRFSNTSTSLVVLFWCLSMSA